MIGAATALLVAASAQAAAHSPKSIVEPGLIKQLDMTPPPAPDLTAVWRRTRALQEAIERNRTHAPVAAQSLSVLDALQSKLRVLRGLDRFRLHSADSALQPELERLKVGLYDAALEARAQPDGVEHALRGPQRDELLRRLQATRKALDDRAVQLNQLASRVAEGLARGPVSRYPAQLVFRDPGTRLDELRTLVRGWEQDSPILSSELNYVRGALQSKPLPTGTSVPAYLSGSTGSSLTLDDSTHGREVELSADVVAKAQALGTAKAASDFVKNELRLDWYCGTLKGCTETLRSGRGNDADLAALLVALLRAQGSPARYVRGTIELPLPKLADLMGLGAFEKETLPAATRDLALQALSTAGIPFEPVVSGGQVASVRLLHVWMKTYIPYADYRGLGSSAEGKQWIPIDPAIPGTAKYLASIPALDALSEMNSTAAQLTDAYLGAKRAAGRPQDLSRPAAAAGGAPVQMSIDRASSAVRPHISASV